MHLMVAQCRWLLVVSGMLLVTTSGPVSALRGPDPVPASTASAEVLVERGWRLLDHGAYRNALDTFLSARALAPDDATVLVGLGVAYQALGDEGQAIAMLERAIHMDIAVAHAHGVLGDLYARRGELERALHHYRLAAEQNPQDISVHARLDRASREYQAELDYNRLYGSNFVLKYPPDTLDDRVIHHLAARLEQIHEEIGAKFQYAPAEPFTVIVYAGRTFWEHTRSPSWARGLFDGVIHVTTDPSQSGGDLSNDLLRHEYVHAVVDRLSAGRVPVWLTEGLALYFEESGSLAELVGNGSDRPAPGMPFPLQRDFVSLAPVDARAAYAHSYRATEQLIRHYGLQSVRTLLETLAATSDFSQAFEQVFRTDYQEFEAVWLGASGLQRQ